ncbi:hypothetical protein B0A50_08203 [Salinomyces thailandicus]|uniref:FAD-binding domain-containing protein n=1 Tax=Salinomyces thailandicus TaxID=706561 RepID=A0A4U0TKB4_9PEZI|nr:hypothetical protein B0A50_08203 [Salinomyces thailandica]
MTSAETTAPFQVAIIGGGLCGLSLAIALQKRSIPFQVYETRGSFTELGAGINIGPNTLRTLQLIDPSLGQALEQIWCRNPPGREDVWMQVRLGAPDGQYEDAKLLTNLMAPPTGNVTMQRNALLQLLAERAGLEHAVFNKKIVSYCQSDEGVVMSFADGSEETASVVIACDGIHSAVRKAMLEPENPITGPQYAGTGAYRSLLSVEDLTAAIGSDMACTSQVFLGPRAYVIMYPIDHGKKVNVGLWPLRPEPWENQHDWVLPAQRDAMQQRFVSWGATIHKIMDLMGNPAFLAAHHHAQNPDSYFDGRVCLLGDAAHAMTPHQGSGAGQAIEDAYVMAEVLRCVDAHKSVSEQVQAAFTGYESIRKPRSEKVLQTSHEAMSWWTGLYEEPLTDERLQKLVKEAEQRFHWIWHDDVAAQAELAVGIMKRKLQR